MNIRRLGSVLGLAFSLLVAASFNVAAHSGSVVQGVLYHVVGNENPRLGNKTTRILFVESEDDGHKVPVDLSGADMPPGGISQALNRRVRVTAATGTNVQALAFDRGDRMIARKLEILSPQRVIAGDNFPLIGTRKYMSLLCKWNGDATEPRAPSFFATQLGSAYPGFNHYFQEVSYARANINGSSALGSWVTTVHAQSFFDTSNPNAGAYLFPMAQECVNAAEALGTDFTGVVGINLMFNGIVDDCCAWGGSGPLVLDGVNRGVSLTWMPYWGTLFPGDTFGWLDHGVLGHELSHSFGSPHSNDPSGYQYGNWWDVVSRPGGTCAVIDATYGCVSQHPVGDNKLVMDFIAPARLATHPINGAMTTYNIERMAGPPNAGGTFQLLKILTPNVNKYYTVEARLRTSYDQNVPGDGVIIHDVIANRPFVNANNPGDPARLITPTGTTASNTGDIDSRWSAGQVYINVTDNVKITVVSFDAGTGTAAIKVEPATAPGEYTFALAGYTVTEGGPAVNLVVNRTAPFTAAGSVTWTTSNGTALAGTDFGTAGSGAQRTGTLTWTAGTGGAKMISVVTGLIPVINDTAVGEVDKAFTVTLSNPVGGVLGAQLSTAVTIKDSDSNIAFDGVAIPVNEVGPNVTATIVRTGATTLSQAVTWRTANGVGAGGALLGTDFGPNAATVQPTGVITFAPGETVKTIAIGPTNVAAPYVRINNDTGVEGPEIFTIVLSAPTNGAVLGGASVATVTINSDEQGVSMGAATVIKQESDGVTSITAVRSGTPTGPLNVNYAFTSTGTYPATNGGVHFTGVNGVVSWADGEGGAKPIPFTIVENAALNTARTFTVTLSGASVGTIAAPTATVVTIADNDNTVQFSGPTTTVAEGVASGNLTLTVTRTGGNAGPASATWTANNGTAVAGTDFGILGNGTPPSGTVSWAGGDSASKSIVIPILNDSTVEGAKNFTVVLSAPVGPNLTIGANPQVTVTLNDNDAGIAFAQAVYNVIEGTNPSVTITVNRIGPFTTAASATWATVNGTATSGQDFGLAGNAAPRTGTISWLAGTNTPKTIVIPILNDALGGEGLESFTVTLVPSAGLVLGTPGIATVNITDDDIPPQSTATFTAPKYTVLENAGPAQVFVNRVDLGGGFGLAASVNYTLQAGTALATSDYTVGSGTLSWGAGASDQKTINIPIVNNTTPESHESFKVLLSGNTPGLGIATPEAAVLILDDDEVFPLDGAVPAGWSVPGGADAGWFVSNDPGAYEGVFALKSEQITDGQTAEISYTDDFLAGTLTFRVKISSEANFDVLRFYLDGSPVASWSGTANTTWQLYSVPIAAGAHTFRWSYEKDGSVTVGSDAASIDGVVMPPLAP